MSCFGRLQCHGLRVTQADVRHTQWKLHLPIVRILLRKNLQ